MKLKYEFLFQPIGNEYVGVPVGDNAVDFNGMLQLDEVSHDIVSRMTEEITRDDLIDQLLVIYDVDRPTLASHLDGVIKYLTSEGVLID